MSGKSLLFPPVAALAFGLGGLCLPLSPSYAEAAAVETAEAEAQSRQGFLGVAVAETRLPADVAADRPGIALVVSQVRPGSPADAAGLRSGDVLLEIDGQTLVHPIQLRHLVAARTAGSVATVTLLRDGEALERAATLGERPGPPEAPEVAEAPAVGPADPPALRVVPADEWPGPMRDDLRRMQEQMDRQFEEMRRLFREGMDDGWPGAEMWQPLRPMDFDFDFGDLEAGGNVRQVFVSDDGQHRLRLTRTGDGRQHLHATDAEGAVLFDGPVDTAEQRAELPEPLGEKLERMRFIRPRVTPDDLKVPNRIDGPGERIAPPRRQAV